MKHFTILTLLVFIFISVFSQVPEAFNYQAVVRDESGNVIAEKNVAFRISILKDSETGTPVYVEEHLAPTNQFGLATLKIGKGTQLQGIFGPGGWGIAPHFIKVEIDPEGGDSYLHMGTTQLLSVPYAFHAQTVANDSVVDDDSDPANELQSISLSGTELTLSDGGGTVSLPSSGGGDNWGSQTVESDATLDGNGTSSNPLSVVGDLTDDQTLSISGNDLSISDGNTVNLPNLWTKNGSDIYFDSGNVGIGLSNPNFPLSISTENDAYQTFYTGNSGEKSNDGFLIGLSSYGNTAWLFNYEEGPIQFGTLNNTRMVIDSEGNVGIGTTRPNAKLDANGSAILGVSGMVISEIREITGTTGTGHSKVISYPSGYNYNNTRVLSLEINFNNTHWSSMGQWVGGSTPGYTVSCSLRSDAILIYYPNTPEMQNKPFRMVLMKTE